LPPDYREVEFAMNVLKNSIIQIGEIGAVKIVCEKKLIG
jgi:hypothetical protein